MADENELRELRERISRLRLSDQLYLFELVLSDYRRKCDEAAVEFRQQIEVLREHERQRETAETAGAKREAG
jgi:hypothetical protein